MLSSRKLWKGWSRNILGVWVGHFTSDAATLGGRTPRDWEYRSSLHLLSKRATSFLQRISSLAPSWKAMEKTVLWLHRTIPW